MDWIHTNRDAITVALAVASLAIAAISFVVRVETPWKVGPRDALKIVAVALLASAGLVWVAGSVAGAGGLASSTGCQWQGTVRWDNGGVGHNAAPKTGSELSIDLPSCSTTLLDGPSFSLDDGTECSGGGQVLCVVVWETTRSDSVTIHGLEAGSNFYGTTQSDYQTVIQAQAPHWWEFPNCTGSGCSGAYVTVYVDGTRIQSNSLMRRP